MTVNIIQPFDKTALHFRVLCHRFEIETCEKGSHVSRIKRAVKGLKTHSKMLVKCGLGMILQI